MIAALLFAVALRCGDGLSLPQEVAVPATNVVGRFARRKRPAPKPREDLTPVEAWHRFCRPGGKVDIPKDERPKPYKKEKPNPHKRKPRK